MILPFSTQLCGTDTHFVEKVSASLKHSPRVAELAIKAGYNFDTEFYLTCKPKIHTMRVDEKGRWYPGMNIHPVINNRSKRMCQFIDAMPCIHTQKVQVKYWYNPATQRFDAPEVYIDGRTLSKKEIDLLAVNDGFANRAEFFGYFNSSWEGKLIHWTNFKY